MVRTSSFFLCSFANKHFIGKILGALTSTPYVPRKTAVKKRAPARRSRAQVPEDEEEDFPMYCEAQIGVNDGAALRSVTINSNMKYLDVLSRVGGAMQRPNNEVQMCYEAHWSQKNGSKKVPAYVTSEDELALFFDSYRRNANKKGGTEGIMFRNMLDQKVRLSVIKTASC